VNLRLEHVPIGNPCAVCGHPESQHRPIRFRVDRRTYEDRGRKYHAPIGDPCLYCQAPASVHISTRELTRRQERRDANKELRAAYDRQRADRQGERLIVGVDGEGVTLCYVCKRNPKHCRCVNPNNVHIYTYLAAVNERGRLVSEAYNENGLSHNECCEMLLEIPKRALKFGFMFSYDVTKIIEDMPLFIRYMLLHPDYRRAFECEDCGTKFVPPHKVCPDCGTVPYRDITRKIRYAGRAYDFFNGTLTVSSNYDVERRVYLRSTHIWDCFRFFGTSFVESIRDWQIYTPGEVPREVDKKWTTGQLERIFEMKQKRGDFVNESADEVKRYCQEECYLLSLLMRKVITSHDTAGLHLARFHGYGTTAGVILKKFEVRKYKENFETLDAKLQNAVMTAFFGGRFEHSVVGLIKTHSRQRDVASAYPYSMTFHPCLACGTWERVKGGKRLLKVIQASRLAVVKFKVKSLTEAEREKIAWMPLPFRSEKGSIIFGSGFEGWAWKNEILAALEGWPELVDITEAYVYNTECGHTPFSFMPSLYIERVRWGKEGPGKSLKGGMNACYGKTAQSKGRKPPFQSWVWAGCTTSDCRSQLLRAIMAARDRWNIHALATDGICSTEVLDLDSPRETGTGGLPKPPLGSWENKEVPGGVLYIKPGMYWALDVTKPEEVRARGIGRREAFKDAPRIVSAFYNWNRKDFDHGVESTSTRFYGAKHCIQARATCVACEKSWPGYQNSGCPECGKAGDKTTVKEMKKNGKPLYGTWDTRITKIKFNPLPKREAVFGGDEDYGRMRIRDLKGKESQTYKKAPISPEGLIAKATKEFALEQPDWD
jgi:DNA polymerase type B, organellar and viral